MTKNELKDSGKNSLTADGGPHHTVIYHSSKQNICHHLCQVLLITQFQGNLHPSLKCKGKLKQHHTWGTENAFSYIILKCSSKKVIEK